MSELDEYRAQKDELFATDHHSPLPHEARHHFQGLRYYDEDPALREGYGLKWGRAQRAVFAAGRAGLPRLLAIAPEPVRLLPPARHAYRRLKLAPA